MKNLPRPNRAVSLPGPLARTRRLESWCAALFGLLLVATLPACGGGDRRRPPPTQPSGGEGGETGLGGAGPGSGGAGSGAQCEEGDQKECTVYVEQASGVTSCWKGVRFCVDGRFTECLEPGAVLPTTENDG